MDILEAGAKGAAAAVVALLIWLAWRLLKWLWSCVQRAPYLAGRASTKVEDVAARTIEAFKAGRRR